jgi:hypothetical protein
MTDGRNEEILSIIDEDLTMGYEDENVRRVVNMIMKYKGNKKMRMLSYSNSDELNEAMIKLGESGSMLEKGELEEARHLVGIGLNLIRESKSDAANSIRCQLHINMLESRLGSNDKDDWRIVEDLGNNMLCKNANNLSERIIKLRIIAKFEDWVGTKTEIAKTIDIYDNIVMHYEDENVRRVINMIMKYKGNKKMRRLPYSYSDELNEAMIKLGESGSMLEKGELEEARHLVGIGLNLIRESKSDAANSIRCQLHINMLESRLGYNDKDDWRIADDLVNKTSEVPAPFTKENFINGPNGDSMLETGLVTIRKKKRNEVIQSKPI